METNERSVVGAKFDQAAQDYDGQRRRLIPCYDDYYHIAVALAETGKENPRILDLGAGTGLLSSLVLKKYPSAQLTLIDLSESMLQAARSRLGGLNQIQYLVDDYTHFTAEQPFDLIISSLSIHHPTDADKQILYTNTYNNLSVGGLFINADQVLGSTPSLDALYKNDWKRKVEASGLTQDQLRSAYERTQLDKMAPLDTQLGWLQEAGFVDVDCVYKYYNFVVMYSRKAGD